MTVLSPYSRTDNGTADTGSKPFISTTHVAAGFSTTARLFASTHGNPSSTRIRRISSLV